MFDPYNVALEILEFLQKTRKRSKLTESLKFTLDEDIDYIKKCLDVLKSNNNEGINQLWTEVQHLSQFFGGDYVDGLDRKRLYDLMSNLYEAMKHKIIEIRTRR